MTKTAAEMQIEMQMMTEIMFWIYLTIVPLGKLIGTVVSTMMLMAAMMIERMVMMIRMEFQIL
tara:strand:+ start:111 stop:299 length:189 start_codon:yes stop_codon:yes gene_type:complete